MTGLSIFGLVLSVVAVVISAAMLLTSPRPTNLEPTDAPSGEYAEPIQGGQR